MTTALEIPRSPAPLWESTSTATGLLIPDGGRTACLPGLEEYWR